MPAAERTERHLPKYRHYKPKDLAVVRIDGKDSAAPGIPGRYDLAVRAECHAVDVLDSGRTNVGSEFSFVLTSARTNTVGGVRSPLGRAATSRPRGARVAEPAGAACSRKGSCFCWSSDSDQTVHPASGRRSPTVARSESV